MIGFGGKGHPALVQGDAKDGDSFRSNPMQRQDFLLGVGGKLLHACDSGGKQRTGRGLSYFREIVFLKSHDYTSESA
jgi:hypothetical protein